jgi:hypothetical protein
MLRELVHLSGDIMVSVFLGESLCAQRVNGKPLAIELTDIIEEMGNLTGSNLWTVIHIQIFNRYRYRELPEWALDSREKALLKRMKAFRQIILDEINKRLQNFDQLE